MEYVLVATVLLGVLLLIYVIVFASLPLPVKLLLRSLKSMSMPKPSDTESDSSAPGEVLSGLPAIYYVLAIFCGIVLLIFTVANSDDLNSFQIGSLIGYTVGSVLSMFAVGRVIELLQQIRDAVRS